MRWYGTLLGVGTTREHVGGMFEQGTRHGLSVNALVGVSGLEVELARVVVVVTRLASFQHKAPSPD